MTGSSVAEQGGKIAAIQMVSSKDVAGNLDQAARLIASAAAQGARVAVLPENFALIESGQIRELAEEELRDRRLSAWLAAQAREHGIWLVAGSSPALLRPDGSRIDDGRVRSRLLVVDQEGKIVASYDKRHLFDVDVGDALSSYRESERFEPGGDEVVVVDSPVGCLGLSICYDLRFPGHYQRLRDLGADILLVPAAFTRVTGEAHWEVLLRARAIETQCYCLGAGQGGVHSPKRQTWGHSMIVDPWGEVLGCKDQGEGVVVAEVDLGKIKRLRAEMPVWQHRRDRWL
ncbi:carbon-nitrogen hydrolase family protein [Marinobacterium sp. D7]|uniref:carbon-nitrogen hydrolase family protein n=1 Tax=Marinobacterium ramblicola TaxID=2849041 RepID=UPI001C2D9AC1|nr:carbon-nitrogen hydrolase family protein [Marinobacterium ramblicola]MBV1787307.1 carbon-nitrogen hydrolase family protein [Marinobacterium ramblicola]